MLSRVSFVSFTSDQGASERVQIHDIVEDSSSECHTEARNILIPSEGVRDYNFDEWSNLFTLPGVYRVAMSVDGYDDIPFQDFKILAPAEVVEVKQNSNLKTTASSPVIAPVIQKTEPVIQTFKEDDDREHDEDDDREHDEYDD